MLTQTLRPVQCEHNLPASGDLPGIVTINGTRYAYRAWTDHTSMTFRHVRLFRNDGFDGKVIDCFLFRDGREDCSCEDFCFRSEPAGRRCKHLQALADLGILGDPPTLPDYDHDGHDQTLRTVDAGEFCWSAEG